MKHNNTLIKRNGVVARYSSSPTENSNNGKNNKRKQQEQHQPTPLLSELETIAYHFDEKKTKKKAPIPLIWKEEEHDDEREMVMEENKIPLNLSLLLGGVVDSGRDNNKTHIPSSTASILSIEDSNNSESSVVTEEEGEEGAAVNYKVPSPLRKDATKHQHLFTRLSSTSSLKQNVETPKFSHGPPAQSGNVFSFSSSSLHLSSSPTSSSSNNRKKPDVKESFDAVINTIKKKLPQPSYVAANLVNNAEEDDPEVDETTRDLNTVEELTSRIDDSLMVQVNKMNLREIMTIKKVLLDTYQQNKADKQLLEESLRHVKLLKNALDVLNAKCKHLETELLKHEQ